MSCEAGPPPVDGDDLEASLDAELGRVLEAYLADLEAGRPDDRERLLAEHPAIARQLRACLQVMNLADRMVDPSDSRSRARRIMPRLDSTTTPPGQSVLTSLGSNSGFGSGSVPRVHLRDLPDEPEPVIKPRSVEMPAQNGASLGRYQVQGEIARGGMGAILKGRDVDLGRELALKVLLESHQGNPEVVSRFIEEAQIGGQLQHPGIAPVYELGAFPEPDRRPYFAMKLVKGQTLAAMLGERDLAPRARAPHPNPPPRRGEGVRNSAQRVEGATNSSQRSAGATNSSPPRPSGERSPQDVGGEGPPREDTGGGAGTSAGRGSPSVGRGSPDPAPVATEGLPPTPNDLPRFLSIFEQVCQTMAYAHARGVIHRDLKPSNIMVGSFGEVQVMDWGLAKVLPQGGVADEAAARPAHETVIMTVRSGSAGSGGDSQAGSVLGTPAYMAPEQARGEIDRIDERADVFGLGAILCEILTGRPPFAGETREEIRAQSARGDLREALGRLGDCGAEAELIELTRDCLAPERARRPRSAGHVSRRVTAFLTGLQERLRTAELARVEAQARASEERKRRQLTLGLAASVLGLAVLGGSGAAYLTAQRTARLMATTQVVTEALAEAERLRGQAQSAALGEISKWSEAMAAVRHARALLAEGEADDALHQKVAAVMADIGRDQTAAEKQAAEVERDRKLLAELEAIRCNRSEHWDRKQTDIDYAAAFRGFGIDPDQLDPEEAGKQIARRSAPVELASYLDDWAVQRRKARDKKDETSWRRLLAAARVADPDPWRAALRDKIGSDDLAALVRLSANGKELDAQSPRSLELLAGALVGRGDRALAVGVLRRAWRIKPDDFWVSYSLAEAYYTGFSNDRLEEAARFYSAAMAIRPRSPAAHHGLGSALFSQGKVDEAVAEFREAMRIRPNAHSHNSLGAILCDVRHDYDGAIIEFRTAIRLEPEFAEAHHNLGVALLAQGKLAEAIAGYREALRLKPDYPDAHNKLAIALNAQGKVGEAIAEYREAIRLKPDYADAHNNLGGALFNHGKPDEGIAEFREAIRLKPDDAKAHGNLGVALRLRGELAEAIVEFRKARDLAKTNSELARQSEQNLIATEQQVLMPARLPQVLAGMLKPANAAETLGFAQLCYNRKLHGSSARLWTEALQAEPKLAGDMQAQNRYNGACAAALAGSGQGKDDPPLEEPTKARWRRQAIDWLKADLAAWSKVLEKGPPAARQSVSQTLEHWKADSDLAGLREAAALAKLPEAEQKACRALWDEVDALLKKAADDKK